MSSNIKMIRGSNRLGAGRKVGTGKFGEATEVLRIPKSDYLVVSLGLLFSCFILHGRLKHSKASFNDSLPILRFMVSITDIRRLDLLDVSIVEKRLV